MKKVLRYTGRILVILLLLPFLYILVAVIGSLIPVNTNHDVEKPDVQIFLRTNGVHTSIITPVKNNITDWREIVNSDYTISERENFHYISFGWGDMKFYKSTPQWSDLTPKTTFQALFLKTPSALHIEFHELIVEDENIISVQVNSEQYQKITNYIRNSFKYDENSNAQPIADLHYNNNDVFYRARRHLNLFYTCNTWVNNALKKSGLRACLWTPFDEGIFYQYN